MDCDLMVSFNVQLPDASDSFFMKVPDATDSVWTKIPEVNINPGKVIMLVNSDVALSDLIADYYNATSDICRAPAP